MTEGTHALTAISPIDGRYAEKTSQLSSCLSEYALIRARLRVMTEYVIMIAAEDGTPCRAFTGYEAQLVRGLAQVSPKEALRIKEIERTTNHDVKACEMYLRECFAGTSFADLVEWLHFGLTSEDVNNCAYALMLHDAKTVLLDANRDVVGMLSAFSMKYQKLPMLSRTHGQPATPTTLGKEFYVFWVRLCVQVETLSEYRITVKLNGASGNYNALVATLPDVNWPDFSRRFIKALGDRYGCRLIMSLGSTQIEPHDTYAELFHAFTRQNTILIDLVQDLWRYISDGWLVQKPKDGEVGSSTMPHKVNPIDFENAEGNLGIANALLEFFARKLPVSRLQRDLSDSTVERSFGTAFGHMLIAYRAIAKGLGKISADEATIVHVLNDSWEVLTEYYQTVLRREGCPNPYDLLKGFSRGRKITKEDCQEFITGLDVSEDIKNEMRRMTPLTYIGLAADCHAI